MSVMRVPHRVVVDRQCNRVLVDGLPFMYPLADETPRSRMDRDDFGVVYLPLLCDEVVYRAAFEASHG